MSRSSRRRRGLAAVLAVAMASVVAVPGAAHAEACPSIGLFGTPIPLPHPGVVWAACLMTGMYATDLSFGGGDLSGSSLSSALLVRSDFSGANLASVTMNGASVSAANFHAANLGGVTAISLNALSANFSGANLSDATFSESFFNGANFAGAQLGAARFEVDSFLGANLQGANLSSSVFSGSDFRYANLQGANLYGADLSSANFFGANLAGATAGTAVWTDAVCPDGVKAQRHVSSSCLKGLDHTAPKVTAVRPVTPFVGAGITVEYSVTDNNVVASGSLRMATQPALGGTQSAWTTLGAGTVATIASPVRGRRYCFEAKAVDAAGHDSGWTAPNCTTTAFDDRWVSADSGWTRSPAPGWLANTRSASSTLGATLSTTTSVAVRRLGLYATTCATCGAVDVYVGSTKVGQLSLHSATTIVGARVTLPRFASTLHGVVRYVVASSGKPVTVDGVLATVW